MANGRLYSAYRGAGKAKSSYKASLSDIYNVGLEAQHSQSMADIEGKRREDAIGMISEGLTLTSNLYEGHKSKKQMSKISKEMGAEVQKQSGLDWLFGAEKEYTYKDKTYTASELKAKYKSDDFKDVIKTEPTKVDKTGVDTTGKKVSDKPTLAEEVGMSEQSRKPGWLSDDKGMIQGYTEDGKKKLRFGEEKGIDTKTKDWFSNLFKGGADTETTVDSDNKPVVKDAQLIPDPVSDVSVATPKQSDLDRVNMYREKNWAPDKTINMDLWNQEKEENFATMFSTDLGGN